MSRTTPVPPTGRVAQIVFFAFTALVWVRGLMAIVVLLLAGRQEPGYVIGFYGAGMVFSLFPALAGYLATRPGGVRYAVALVAAFGMCFAGLASLRDNPLMGLLYGLLGVTAVVFVLISTSFFVGRNRGAAAPSVPQAGTTVDGRPAPNGGWFPPPPYSRQKPPVAPPPQWRPPQADPGHRPPQVPPYGGHPGS